MYKIIVMAIAFSAALSGAALAGDFKVAPHGSYLIDLDTADDSFSVWRSEDLGELNAVHARMRIARCGKSKQYACQGHIRLSSGDKSVSIEVISLKPGAPLYVTLDDGVDSHRQMFLSPPEADEAFDFHIRWSADGKISFDLYDKLNHGIGQGFEHREYDLAAPVKSMEVTGSTSEVEFNKLELGSE
ncbi:MAG: hypothetical protein ACXU8U_10210 [Asticcacaulis sp.]